MVNEFIRMKLIFAFVRHVFMYLYHFKSRTKQLYVDRSEENKQTKLNGYSFAIFHHITQW